MRGVRETPQRARGHTCGRARVAAAAQRVRRSPRQLRARSCGAGILARGLCAMPRGADCVSIPAVDVVRLGRVWSVWVARCGGAPGAPTGRRGCEQTESSRRVHVLG